MRKRPYLIPFKVAEVDSSKLISINGPLLSSQKGNATRIGVLTTSWKGRDGSTTSGGMMGGDGVRDRPAQKFDAYLRDIPALRTHVAEDCLTRLLLLSGLLDIASAAWISPVSDQGFLEKPLAEVGQHDGIDLSLAIRTCNEIPALFTERSAFFAVPGMKDYQVCAIGDRTVGRAALFVRPHLWRGSAQGLFSDVLEKIRFAIELAWPLLVETGGKFPSPNPSIKDAITVEALADQCPFGMLVIGVDQVVHFFNSPARELMKSGGPIGMNLNRLMFVDASDGVRFQVALQGTLIRAAGSRETIVVTSGDGSLLLIAISRIPNLDGDPRACVIITRSITDASCHIKPIAAHFHLSAVETRLVAQLMNGLSVGDAAEMLRLKVQTARTYLKQIFQKTGTHRQTELIQLMHSGNLPIL